MSSSKETSHTGKIAHESYDDAVRERKRMRRAGASVDLEVYRCRHCHKWHVGHSRQSLNHRIKVALGHTPRVRRRR